MAVKKKIELTYCGKRYKTDLKGGGKLTHLFINNKDEFFYSNIKNVYIGHIYEAHEKDNGIFLSNHPKDITPKDFQHPKWDEFWSKEIADKQKYKDYMYSKKLEKGLVLIEELNTLRKITKKLTYIEKRRFCEWLTHELIKVK